MYGGDVYMSRCLRVNMQTSPPYQTEPQASSVPLKGPEPLYYQLCQLLRERILSGAWKPGDQLPTLQETCNSHGVSRTVVVQALALLDREGLLMRRQGKGIFVAQPDKLEQGPTRLLSFTEETRRRGHEPSSRTLRIARERAPLAVASALNVRPRSRLVVLERLRLADGQPMGFQRAYLPEPFFPGLAELDEPIESIYQVLQTRFGVIPTTATDTYEPMLLDNEMARLLEQPPGSPAFAVQRITRDQHDRIIEFVESVLRGDRYKVILKLERVGPRLL